MSEQDPGSIPEGTNPSGDINPGVVPTDGTTTPAPGDAPQVGPATDTDDTSTWLRDARARMERQRTEPQAATRPARAETRTTTENLSPEETELQDFLRRVEYVRTSPREAAQLIKQQSETIAVEHTGGIIGSLAGNRTVTVIEKKEHSKRVGAQRRDTHSINPFGIRSDRWKHRANINEEIKVLRRYSESAAHVLERVRPNALSNSDIEHYAALIIHNELLLGRRLPSGDRDNASGYDGDHSLKLPVVQDISKVIDARVDKYRDLIERKRKDAQEAAEAAARQQRNAEEAEAKRQQEDEEAAAAAAEQEPEPISLSERIKSRRPDRQPATEPEEFELSSEDVSLEISEANVSGVIELIMDYPDAVLRVLRTRNDSSDADKIVIDAVEQVALRRGLSLNDYEADYQKRVAGHVKRMVARTK